VKTYKKLLVCVLTLVLMTGLVPPLGFLTLEQGTAEASGYTLTVLNPMGPLVPMQQISPACRQPLQDKLDARGDAGPVRVLILNYDKNFDQLQLWALALMLEEMWEAEYPGTKVELVAIDPAGGPTVHGVDPPSWDWNTNGTIPRLGSPWGPKTGMGHIDGMPLQEEPFARYQYWANNFDLVIFGEQN